MSDPLRIGLVSEGITDRVVIEAAVRSMIGAAPYIMSQLQPEESAFTGEGNAGPLGGGWKGVRKWCLSAAERSGGDLSEDPLFLTFDTLILHLDVDVTGENDLAPELVTQDVAGVRSMLLAWTGSRQCPPRVILCTPSMSTESWVMKMFFPNDREMNRKGWETHPKPEARLTQQPKEWRFGKQFKDYASRSEAMTNEWPRVAEALSMAKLFRDDFARATAI